MASGTINTNNYTLGGAQLYFDASIGQSALLVATSFATTARSLGNIITSGITPEITYIDHMVTRKGKQLKDKIAAGLSTLRINFTFDEINSTNLSRFFMGSLSNGRVNIFANTLDEGSGMLVVETDVGRDIVYRIPRCVIKPDGELSFPGDSWASAAMVIEVLEYQTGGTDVATQNASWLVFPFGRLDVTSL